jgi:hypothetical protein
MLAVEKRLMTSKGDDVAALLQQIAALKTEGAEASAAVDALKRDRALATSYDKAVELDGRIARQVWTTEHLAAALPELELRLAAARAADQAAALARHKGILLDLYPKLKRAIFAAVDLQHEAIAAREAACKELGEATVFRNLPTIAFAGFLLKDLVAIWQAENDRVFADLARKPTPAAIPAPVRAALPPPAKPKTPVAEPKQPAARPPRVVRHDAFPTDGQQALVVFMRSGVELPDSTTARIGDEVALPVEQARALVLRGACDYVSAPAAEAVKQ